MIHRFAAVALVIAILTSCSSPVAPATPPAAAVAQPTTVAVGATPPTGPSPTVLASSPIGQRTKTSGCQARGALPDTACTPGAIIASATKDQVCVPGYSKAIRNVSTAEKDQVFGEYGVTTHPVGAYEVDHLISLELGGSNEIANLWPEPAEPRPGFHEKDRVENQLHADLCAGKITLAEAQHLIASNWLDVYNRGVVAAANAIGDSSLDEGATTAAPTTAASAPLAPTQPSAAGTPAPAPPTVVSTTGHTYYLSSAAKTYYYCDTDPEWKTLSPTNLVHLTSLAEVQQRYPTLTLRRPC